MASFSVKNGNWALECAAEKYTKQTILSKDYKLFLSKYNYHILIIKEHLWHILLILFASNGTTSCHGVSCKNVFSCLWMPFFFFRKNEDETLLVFFVNNESKLSWYTFWHC